MKASQWMTYRTRFLVKAKKLTATLSFTDHLGRQHCGRRGDYLVESFDGVLSIAPRQIFEDIYVPMQSDENPAPETSHRGVVSGHSKTTDVDRQRIEPLRVERIKSERIQPRFSDLRPITSDASQKVRRKSPQPVRTNSAHAGLM
jgi:hypothetical protein